MSKASSVVASVTQQSRQRVVRVVACCFHVAYDPEKLATKPRRY